MEFNQYSSIFWDFGGVITSSPFEAFNKFEKDNKLPENFLRKVNSTNPENNAWALLEQSKINQEEFDKLFFQDAPGSKRISLKNIVPTIPRARNSIFDLLLSKKS